MWNARYRREKYIDAFGEKLRNENQFGNQDVKRRKYLDVTSGKKMDIC